MDKSIKINENIHKKIKLFCVNNNLNIYKFVEKTLLDKINDINKEKENNHNK